MTRDLVFGGAAFALAVGYYLLAVTIPTSLLADAIGPQGLPKAYAALLAGLSLVLIIRSVLHTVRRKPDTTSELPDTTSEPIVRSVRLTTFAKATAVKKPDLESADSHEPATQRQTLWRVAGLLAIGVAYVVVVPRLGYMLSLAALIMATTYYQGGALNRHVVVVAMSGAVVFWLLFVMLLGIPQPAGLWPSLS
jgi:putative tricarboxylic transport membrane protein